MNAAVSIVALTLAASSAMVQEGPSAPPVASPATDAATPADGSAPDNRPTLWQNIRVGMTADEVRSLYPASEVVRYRRRHTEIDDFPIVGRCQAEVNIQHPEGIVERVLLKGKGVPADGCPEAVIAALATRYGQPLSEVDAARYASAPGFQLTTWQSGRTTIRFSRQVSGSTLGVGLFRGSWELEYVQTEAAAAL